MRQEVTRRDDQTKRDKERERERKRRRYLKKGFSWQQGRFRNTHLKKSDRDATTLEKNLFLFSSFSSCIGTFEKWSNLKPRIQLAS